MVPHLTTALNGPLLSLEKSMLAAMPKIEHWFRTQWLEYAAPFYASVDLRNAGFKLAPVDTNLSSHLAYRLRWWQLKKSAPRHIAY